MEKENKNCNACKKQITNKDYKTNFGYCNECEQDIRYGSSSIELGRIYDDMGEKWILEKIKEFKED